MVTLSYGFKKPSAPDRGNIVFPAMEDNIQRLNDHTHDGSNSAPVPGSSIVAGSTTLLAASWVSLGGGHYRQQGTVPAGYNFDTQTMSFRLTSGHYIYPTVEKISATQFWVYTIDNTLDYVVVMGG